MQRATSQQSEINVWNVSRYNSPLKSVGLVQDSQRSIVILHRFATLQICHWCNVNTQKQDNFSEKIIFCKAKNEFTRQLLDYTTPLWLVLRRTYSNTVKLLHSSPWLHSLFFQILKMCRSNVSCYKKNGLNTSENNCYTRVNSIYYSPGEEASSRLITSPVHCWGPVSLGVMHLIKNSNSTKSKLRK